MHDDNGLCSWSNRAADGFCGDILTFGVDVNANRAGAPHDDATGGCDESAGTGDDLMPASDPERLQGQFECDRSIGQADGMFCANGSSEFGLKQAAFLPGPIVDFS